MAFGKNNKPVKKVEVEEVVTSNETEQTIDAVEPTVEETPVTEKPAVVEKPSASKSERVVTVRGMQNHDCSIGGKTYFIEKGKEQKVPIGVALILVQSGIAFQTA